MRTDLRRSIMAATGAAAGLVIAVSAAAFTVSPATLTLDHIERLEHNYVSLTSATPTASTIESAQALKVSEQFYDWSRLGASVDAYLVSATDQATAGTEMELRERLVWLLVVSEFEIHRAGPMTEDGIPAESGTVGHGYVFCRRNLGHVPDDHMDRVVTTWRKAIG